MPERETGPSERPGAALCLCTLDVLFVASLVFLPVLWMVSEIRWPWLGAAGVTRWKAGWLALPVVLLILRSVRKSWLLRGGTRCRGILEAPLLRKLCLAVASTFLFFLAVETVLEGVGFERKVAPIVIVGRGETEQTAPAEGIVPDSELRWKYTAGGTFRGRPVNRLGFLDREVAPEKPAGTVRVICMGDSCSAQGSPPYSGFLHALLTNAPPTAGAWEAFNMAVHGYSAVQGLRLFEMRVPPLRPDVVTLYYGWNDHWQGGRLPDIGRMAIRANRLQAAVLGVLGKKRFGQLLIAALTPDWSPALRQKYDGLRVPPEDYRYTLTRFVTAIRAAGAVPVLITAPRAPALTGIIARNRGERSLAQVAELHDQYAQITRDVAAECRAPLLDLHRLLSGAASAPLFEPDGIHFIKDGRRRIAAEIYETLCDLASTPQFQSRRPAPDTRRKKS